MQNTICEMRSSVDGSGNNTHKIILLPFPLPSSFCNNRKHCFSPKKCLQVEKMRDCMALEGWRWHKLLPSTWRVKVVSLDY